MGHGRYSISRVWRDLRQYAWVTSGEWADRELAVAVRGALGADQFPALIQPDSCVNHGEPVAATPALDPDAPGETDECGSRSLDDLLGEIPEGETQS